MVAAPPAQCLVHCGGVRGYLPFAVPSPGSPRLQPRDAGVHDWS